MIGALVTVNVTGADVTQTLLRITDRGVILLRAVPKDDLTVQLTLRWQDFHSFREICEKRGDRMEIVGRQGAYWKLKAALSHPILLLCFALILLATLYLPSRVLFVRVEGNSAVPTREIIHMAERCGIGFGASRRAVRSERMKNALLETAPELQWVGVNTRGCVAIITVRERAEQERAEADSTFGHIVALTDGVVTQCTATRGSLMCAPGQAVRAGQILISGYTDTGLCIRAEQAQGEIMGLTIRKIRAAAPTFSVSAAETGECLKKISILLGKKRIILWKDSGIWDATCGRMYEEYYITLPGGFSLPVAVAVERFAVKEKVLREIPQPETQSLLSAFAEGYLRKSMIAGTVHARDMFFSQEPGLLILAGEYRCAELIGVKQRLQIGE